MEYLRSSTRLVLLFVLTYLTQLDLNVNELDVLADEEALLGIPAMQMFDIFVYEVYIFKTSRTAIWSSIC